MCNYLLWLIVYAAIPLAHSRNSHTRLQAHTSHSHSRNWLTLMIHTHYMCFCVVYYTRVFIQTHRVFGRTHTRTHASTHTLAHTLTHSHTHTHTHTPNTHNPQFYLGDRSFHVHSSGLCGGSGIPRCNLAEAHRH